MWGKNSQPPVSSVLHLIISDQGTELFVRLDEDGRARFIEYAEPTVQLSMTTADLVHRMCGRVDASDPEFLARLKVAGPDDLVQRLLNGMTITP